MNVAELKILKQLHFMLTHKNVSMDPHHILYYLFNFKEIIFIAEFHIT